MPRTPHRSLYPRRPWLRRCQSRMVLLPVLGDFDPPREPYIGKRLGVFDEFRNRPGAPRMTRHAHVQADRHHLGMGRAFLIEPVEGVAQMLLEILGLAEMPLRESRVVVDQRVRDHEML